MSYLETIKAEKGQFYTVGIGPGSTELITLKAMRLIQTADLVIAPKSKLATESIALKACLPIMNSDVEVYEHVYSMSKDEKTTLESWGEMAKIAAERMNKGQSVVHITIGEPLIYSTAHYIIEELRKYVSEDTINVVPGISAFQTIASKFKKSLVIQEGRFTLMTGTDIPRIENAIKHAETVVLYKCGKNLDNLLEMIERNDLVDRAKLVCYADQDEREVVFEDIREIRNKKPGYMATIIIYVGTEGWN